MVDRDVARCDDLVHKILYVYTVGKGAAATGSVVDCQAGVGPR